MHLCCIVVGNEAVLLTMHGECLDKADTVLSQIFGCVEGGSGSSGGLTVVSLYSFYPSSFTVNNDQRRVDA
jgi:hypothetical protein